MITVSEITLTYPSGATPIFKKFSWEVKRGDSWVIIGPSGCGKTTLLYLLAGLLQPDSGSIRIDNQAVIRPRPKSGLILQDYGLLPWATVQQNINLGKKIRNYYGADGIHAPSELQSTLNDTNWLLELGLNSISDKYPSQLSGGQRQRTAIARTLSLQPDLLLMDEPFSSLDVPTRENLQKLTTDLVAKQGLTLVLVTHSIEEAVLLGRKILLLSNPPNHKLDIYDNSESGRTEFRNSVGFSNLYKELRTRLGTI